DALQSAGIDLYSNVGPSKDHWLSAGAGIGGVHYAMIFGKDGVRVEFALSGRTQEENKAMFDYLFARKEEIERTFENPMEWRRLDDKKASIIVFGQAFDGYNRESWPSMIKWLVEHVRRIEKTFKPQIAPLRRVLKTRFTKPT